MSVPFTKRLLRDYLHREYMDGKKLTPEIITSIAEAAAVDVQTMTKDSLPDYTEDGSGAR